MSRQLLCIVSSLALTACDDATSQRREFLADDRRVCLRLADGESFPARRTHILAGDAVIVFNDENDVGHRIDDTNSHQFQCRRVKSGEVWP